MNFFKKNKLLLSAVAIIVAIVALDLFTKVLAENYLTGTVEIIGKWMTLHFITNGGASFSFLDAGKDKFKDKHPKKGHEKTV